MAYTITQKINNIIINTDKETINIIPDRAGEHYISFTNEYTELLPGMLRDHKHCEIGIDVKDTLIIVNE